ncbi:hypothetical protein HOP50_05g37920 [Chloropicon primus]|uniref:NAD(P)-binding domain-containing protein n=1 Tax=Chloropicon primus TaxID=1764295 RepID=A0A5B8MLB9_9CHLO|nr:hypothetical protein A3770_05p37810 [Chloropicon primus]UPR00477.1 hypothetical protein HOP50_05g37920 [Chloropicon primus]|eukprot:QDZ21263.1 hypothetical protein A3770_05p37810 [Chloropicon primus]
MSMDPRVGRVEAEGGAGMRMKGTREDQSSATSRDLLVIGPGVLGRLFASKWKEENASARLVGETATNLNHEELKEVGCFDGIRTREDATTDEGKFPFVLFSAPPSGSENYLEEVERAASKWDGTGCFLFTGSAAVYDLEHGECTEVSKIKEMGSSERTDRLLNCENAVLGKGGSVARLVGLYHSKRGAHMYFLKIQNVPRWGDSVINLIHYEDAADLCYSIMTGERKGEVFLGCDSNPISFQKMMDATLMSGEYTGHFKFTGEEQEFAGKLASNNQTREALGWKPKFESFESFMSAGARDKFSGLSEER